LFFAFSNVFDPGNGYPGLSGVFGPDSFEFPRREAVAADGEGMATAVVDTTNLDTSIRPTSCAGKIWSRCGCRIATAP